MNAKMWNTRMSLCLVTLWGLKNIGDLLTFSLQLMIQAPFFVPLDKALMGYSSGL